MKKKEKERKRREKRRKKEEKLKRNLANEEERQNKKKKKMEVNEEEEYDFERNFKRSLQEHLSQVDISQDSQIDQHGGETPLKALRIHENVSLVGNGAGANVSDFDDNFVYDNFGARNCGMGNGQGNFYQGEYYGHNCNPYSYQKKKSENACCTLI